LLSFDQGLKLLKQQVKVVQQVVTELMQVELELGHQPEKMAQVNPKASELILTAVQELLLTHLFFISATHQTVVE
jgi:hypothetical protein